MLDWGCGLGQYAEFARGLYPELVLDYHCRELDGLTRVARELLPGDTFHDDDESALGRTYDLVMASGSLQYLEDWQGALGRLASAARGFTYVTRLPVVTSVDSFVVVQRPHARGYLTEYPGWFINREAFLDRAREVGLTLDREFLVTEAAHVPGAPEQARFRGFLFSKGVDARPANTPPVERHADGPR
jgi:putative methyltransferase (TIGR04325 family)